MNIKGKILTQRTMTEMKVGETGFLHWGAIILINRKQILINPNYDITTYVTDNCMVPIIRTGKGEEDYEINLFINKTFFNEIFSEKEIQELKREAKLIGPYDVDIELDQNDKNQLYPRMSFTELINDFISWNAPLIEGRVLEDAQDIYIENKENTKIYIIQCIEKMDLELVEYYKESFKNIKNEDGAYNPCQDEELDMVVAERIKLLKNRKRYEEMSLKELEEKKQQYIDQERYEKLPEVQIFIDKKQQ